jgi:Ethanolamine ammonia-lyase, small subunit
MIKNLDIDKTDIKKIPMKDFTELSATDEEALKDFKKFTPARIGIGRAGARCATHSYLRFLADRQAAADAVYGEVSVEAVEKSGLFEIRTVCKNKFEMLTRPDLGRIFPEESEKILAERCKIGADVQLYVGDGLSAPAFVNALDIIPAITAALEYDGITVGTPFFVKYCRVNTARRIGVLLKPKVTAVLIGERPGMATDESMSAYIAYDARPEMSESDYTVISNIGRNGLPAVEAAAHIADLIKEMLRRGKSGYGLI